MTRGGFRPLLTAAACLALVPLSACATGNSYSKARTPIERADAALQRVRGAADIMLPRLPAPIADRVRRGLTIADAALTIARADGDPFERERALRQLAGAVAAIAVDIALR